MGRGATFSGSEEMKVQWQKRRRSRDPGPDSIPATWIDFPVVLTGNSREVQIQSEDPNFDLFGAVRAAFDALSPTEQIDNG
jgi:hypothetical protein